jgi:regulator of protease activity HflC (stomatin/prohibitin superfamily)
VESKVIDPRIQEVVKAVVARYSAEELLAKREEVKQEVELALRNQLASYNIVVEAIQITNFQFSASFDHAIEAKQTAEQNALKAKNDLERIKIEADQKIAMAKAEAETIRIQADAIRAQGGAEYVQLKAIEKWNGQLPQVSGANTPFISLTPQR